MLHFGSNLLNGVRGSRRCDRECDSSARSSKALRAVLNSYGQLYLLAAMLVSAASGVAQERLPTTKVSYERDVVPILAQHCFPCHGPDQAARQATLRLDMRTAALEMRTNGAALVPGDAGASLIWQRVTSEDGDQRMPPVESGKKLLDEQRETLRKWIEEGGVYEQHWAFRPLTRPSVPSIEAEKIGRAHV